MYGSHHFGVGKGIKKLPKFDRNDLRLLFHYYILIPRKCPRKTYFNTQWGGASSNEMGIICPPPSLVEIGLTDLSKSGRADMPLRPSDSESPAQVYSTNYYYNCKNLAGFWVLPKSYISWVRKFCQILLIDSIE